MRQLKLKLFKTSTCPRFVWGFFICDFPITHMASNQAAASCHVRVGAAWKNRLAEVDCSYSKAMAAWTTMYKKLHTAKAARHISPKDPVVRSLPLRRLWIKPSCWGLSSTFSKRWWRQWRKTLVPQIWLPHMLRQKFRQQTMQACLTHCADLTVLGQTMRTFQGNADLWSTTLSSLRNPSSSLLSNSDTNTLAHNKDLYLWWKLALPQCQVCK